MLKWLSELHTIGLGRGRLLVETARLVIHVLLFAHTPGMAAIIEPIFAHMPGMAANHTLNFAHMPGGLRYKYT
ncbi:hypothetical protein HanHA300_Chr11g0409491 [Helianthus annuus]|nr:hypothetical protein HanHA300_Chr11g0409491 [Helianthus annuus]KAJ0518076.1 hypothetical protein HanHA89_Chr11g0433151 [Helianthus annuus]KAJ0686102.1 hypothetical protein HanLR1_Chr11g0410751 [Helianthus annuus]KAJ0689949.1 hypothetical protein HanOQP8_Chr11g0412111 [Helianthus annuus]